MNVKKIVGFLALALLIFYVVTQPGSAASSLQGIGSFLQNTANSLVTFFGQILPNG